MLLIEKLINIVHLKSATAIMNVKKDSFFVQGHFPGQPVMPGVLIVEAFGQAAAALTALGIDPKEYENKLVYLMSVEKAKFRIQLFQTVNYIWKLKRSDHMVEFGNIKEQLKLTVKEWQMLNGLQLLLIENK